MALNREHIVIARALIALSNSVMELEEALEVLAPSQDENFAEHLKACAEARERCSQNLKLLVDLMDRDAEQHRS